MINSVNQDTKQTIDVYAHRGSSMLAPENTAVAFDLALSFGADVLEIDVRLSRDNVVFVAHDSRVDRTCNAQGEFSSLTTVELKKLHAGWHFSNLDGKTFKEKKVELITLDELFERYPDTRINIDIKDNSKEAAQAVAKSIERAAAQSRVNVGSFHANALNHFRLSLPGVTTAASQAEVAKLYFGRGMNRAVAFQYLQIPTEYYGIPLSSPRFIKFAQQRNISAVYWTINEPEHMKTLISRGVDGIVTDRVDIACKLLNKTAKL